MKKILTTTLCSLYLIASAFSQSKVMTPEQLIELNRVSAVGLTDDGQQVIYRTSTFDLETNERSSQYYSVSVNGGVVQAVDGVGDLVKDKNESPDGKWKLVAKDVKIEKVSGQDHYGDVPNSNVYIYDQLNYRHWDTWEDGAYSHVFIQTITDSYSDKGLDLMAGEPHDCPQKPFGGDEDYIWSPDSKKVLYVTKKLAGTQYAVSTNSDIYEYDLETKKTTNLTDYNEGYDTHPLFSSTGTLAWLQMKRDGYESDKNDIIVRTEEGDINITEDWDGTVNGFIWSQDGSKIYFSAPVGGTVHAFEIDVPNSRADITPPRQISEGQFDVNGIIGQSGDKLIVYRRDMNHAAEIYNLNIATGEMKKLSNANDDIYADIKMSKIEKRMVKTTDGKDMVTWVIYPPDFDPNKKYPTLLYCQGGPQGALSQFYSFRWNFQLMAANGYIIVAPNRRGMPGYGVEWNEQISKDYGGQNMRDYLSAIDDVAKEPYVDNDRLGCIGASYGGYSVFYLASRHEGRFKSFISHDGIFNWRSMYGTTEELFFVNWDLGGPYWDKDNAAAQKSYAQFNPINFVDQWDTPILIIQGGLDFRVPIGQGLEAFQAAQLQGIKSKLLYFPEENHWVLSAQNSLVWQREFYKWLDETVKNAE